MRTAGPFVVSEVQRRGVSSNVEPGPRKRRACANCACRGRRADGPPPPRGSGVEQHLHGACRTGRPAAGHPRRPPTPTRVTVEPATDAPTRSCGASSTSNPGSQQLELTPQPASRVGDPQRASNVNARDVGTSDRHSHSELRTVSRCRAAAALPLGRSAHPVSHARRRGPEPNFQRSR